MKEKARDLNDVPVDVWTLLVPRITRRDMKSLSLTSNDMLKKMRHEKIVKEYLWRVPNNDNLPPWISFVQRVEIDSLNTLEALKERGCFLTQINFVEPFNDPIYQDAFPDTVKSIRITSNAFNQPLYELPRSLVNLFLSSSRFNQPVDTLPVGLKELFISSDVFNEPVDNLPPGLSGLSIISGIFNQFIDDLPAELKELIIWSDEFNPPIQSLPQGLEEIVFGGNSFNQPIDGIFPLSLTSIELGDEFSHPIPYFPNLRHFVCNSENLPDQDYVFSTDIRSLDLGTKIIIFH
jgi:hypothetical protein